MIDIKNIIPIHITKTLGLKNIDDVINCLCVDPFIRPSSSPGFHLNLIMTKLIKNQIPRMRNYIYDFKEGIK